MNNEQINQMLSDLKCYIFKFNEKTNTIEHNNIIGSSIHITMELSNIIYELNSLNISYEVDEDENVVIA